MRIAVSRQPGAERDVSPLERQLAHPDDAVGVEGEARPSSSMTGSPSTSS
jgi:hypothetical protein